MKRGIEVHHEVDAGGIDCVKIYKSRGKLTLEEIRDAAREWETDYYLLFLDCYHTEEDSIAYAGIPGYEEPKGDMAILYFADHLAELQGLM